MTEKAVPETPSGEPLEIERRFLIERPDEAVLAAWPGAHRYAIEQIYLPDSADGRHGRVRHRSSADGDEYFYTAKLRFTDMTRVELEHRITAEEYRAFSASAHIDGEAPAKISKVRWCLPCEGHVAEVDIYPFWDRRAVVEVELGREDEQFTLPPILKVLREVTGVRGLNNRDMACFMRDNGRPPHEPE